MNSNGLIFPHPEFNSGLVQDFPQVSGAGAVGRAGTHRVIRSIWKTAGRARQWRWLAGGNRGAILLETVIASMVFALVGVAVLSGLEMIYTHGARVEVQSTAENLVRNQLEDVFSEAYSQPLTPYPTSVGVPAGYTVTVTATDMATPDPNIEKLNVAVAHDGVTIMSIDTIRFNKP